MKKSLTLQSRHFKWITHGHLAPHKDPKYLPSFPPPISNIPCLLGALCYLDRENGHSKLRDSLRIWYRSLLGLLGRDHNGCLLNCPKFCVPRFFYNDDNLVMFTLFFLPFSPKIIFARILNKEHIAAVKSSIVRDLCRTFLYCQKRRTTQSVFAGKKMEGGRVKIARNARNFFTYPSHLSLQNRTVLF